MPHRVGLGRNIPILPIKKSEIVEYSQKVWQFLVFEIDPSRKEEGVTRHIFVKCLITSVKLIEVKLVEFRRFF